MFDRAEREHNNYNPNNLYGLGKNFARKKEAPSGYTAREHAGGDYDTATGIYIIKQGDTLYSIAQRFNINVDALKHLNSADALKMDPGAKLKITPGMHVDETKKETTTEHKHTDAPGKDEKKPADTFSLSHVEEVLSGFSPSSLWEKFMHPAAGLSKPAGEKSAVSTPEKNTKFDIDKTIKTLDDNAKTASVHKCGLYIANALQAGGINVAANGADYGPLLSAHGFSVVSKKNYSPRKGDVVVFDATSTHSYGHVAMWDGTEWVSDFKQGPIGERPGYEGMGKGFMVYSSDIPNTTIYRH